MVFIVKTFKQLLFTVFILTFVFGSVSTLWGQRQISYRDLAMQNQQQQLFFNFIKLPGDQDDSIKFSSVFSFSNSYLPFKKLQSSSSENKFFSTVNLNMEVFDTGNRKINRKKNRRDNISVKGLESVGRAFWSDTAYATSYDQSQSKDEYLNGHLSVSLKPGKYYYVLQMNRGDETDDRTSRTQVVTIEPYEQMMTGNIIYGQELIDNETSPQLTLSQMGNSVEYAKDFYALAYLPGYESNASYSVTIHRLDIAEEDTNTINQVYNKQLTSDDIRTGVHPELESSSDASHINLNPSDNGFTYALIKIPNSNFPNALYRMTVKKADQQQPAAQGVFRSLWVDMPTSLLNLEVATEMLRFIADEKTMDRLSNGSRAERERKFREYWEKRDPSPDTEFNELMAEYYRRIDYAYKNFSGQNVPGYESDQGKIYIKFGPPKDINRKFPTNGPTTEIWTYDNRQFVFRATSGFGDFKLVSDQSN